MNPLLELRKRRGLTGEAMGKLLGVKPSTVQKYESDPPEEIAHKYLHFAKQWGQHDLAPAIRRMTGESHTKSTKLDPEEWTDHEQELVVGLIDIVRHPQTETDKAIPKFLADLLEHRRTRKK